MIRQEKKLKVPDGYEDSFRKTDAVFKYQSVFDPRSKKIVRLNEVAQDDNVTDEELTFAGPYPLSNAILSIIGDDISPNLFCGVVFVCRCCPRQIHSVNTLCYKYL